MLLFLKRDFRGSWFWKENQGTQSNSTIYSISTSLLRLDHYPRELVPSEEMCSTSQCVALLSFSFKLCNTAAVYGHQYCFLWLWSPTVSLSKRTIGHTGIYTPRPWTLHEAPGKPSCAASSHTWLQLKRRLGDHKKYGSGINVGPFY